MDRPRLGPYRELLRHPGALTLALFGLLGRAPMAMFPVALVAAAAGATGGGAGYALGGAAAGASAFASAVAAPPIGRLVDRHGQGAIPRLLALVCAGAALAIVASLLTLGATPLIVPLAALAGATQPAIGTLTRARWMALLHGTPAGDSAQALESINDEISFLIGPSLVAVLATVGFVGLPIVVGSLLLVSGVFGLTSRRSLPPPPPHPRVDGESRWPPFPAGRSVLVSTCLLGIALGSVQVLQLAYCRALGLETGAALVFFVYSAASLTGAIVVGAIAWRQPPRRRLALSLLVYVAGLLPSALVSGYPAFVVASLLAGVAIAPTFIQANALVAEATPTRYRTGAFAVLGSATILGIAAGSAVTGAAVDALGADAARAVLIPMAAAVGLAGLLVARSGVSSDGSAR